MKIAPAILIALLLLGACSSETPSSEKSATPENNDKQILKYEVREPTFDSSKTVELPKNPPSSLDQ